MLLTTTHPFADLDRIQREFFGGLSPVRARRPEFSPAVDVRETEQAIVLTAELPGISRDDLEIEVHKNLLTLKGERKLEQKQEGDRYYRVERSHGSFVRHFQLPTTVDADAIGAELADGVLTLTLPKKAEAQPKRIAVA